MGMFSRITDIINANINSLLEKAENPEKLIRLIIQEMEETLVEVRSTAAKSIADKKHLTRESARLEANIANWQEKAELALNKDREDLARSALSAKQTAQQELAQLNEEMTIVDDLLAKVQEDSQRLQDKLQEAKRRQETIALRKNSAQARLKTRQTLNTENIDSAIAKFDSYQQKVERLEAEVEAYDLVKNQSLESQFAELEQADDVEAELAQLKKKVVNG